MFFFLSRVALVSTSHRIMISPHVVLCRPERACCSTTKLVFVSRTVVVVHVHVSRCCERQHAWPGGVYTPACAAITMYMYVLVGPLWARWSASQAVAANCKQSHVAASSSAVSSGPSSSRAS